MLKIHLACNSSCYYGARIKYRKNKSSIYLACNPSYTTKVAFSSMKWSTHSVHEYFNHDESTQSNLSLSYLSLFSPVI